MQNWHNKFYKMIEQGNRTQQLIYRTSYRKHKERLADIRQNITANDFLPPRNHQSAKKQSQKIRMKNEELQSGNFYMKSKLNAIKHRANSKIDELFSTEQLRKQPKRYFDHSNQVKVQISSEMNDGDNIKFVLPSQKHQSTSVNTKIKDGQKADNTVAQTKLNSIEKSYKKFTSNSILKDSQREIKTAKQPQLFYNLPQRNENRVVIYKKTLVFSSMQSCLLELSLINQRLLIAAYLMGLENTTLRELYPLKRTVQLLKECQNNYEQLCSRIFIQKVNDKYQLIRIASKQDEIKEQQQKQQDKIKQKTKIQNDFIKRNYYTLVKTDEQQKEEPKQSKPSFTFDHVQAIVDRLAVPKRFFKLKQQKIEKTKAVSNYQRPSNSYQFSHEQLARPEKRNSVQNNKQSQQSINKQKQPIMKISEKQSQKKLVISNKKQTVQNIDNKSILLAEKEKRVEQNQNYQEMYEQQFDNPSYIKNSKLHSLQESKPINSSLVSNKSKESKIVKQSQKIAQNNESEVYEHEFQKQAEQQYAEQFENNNQQLSPVAKIANNSSAPVENVEEQYQQQFAD